MLGFSGSPRKVLVPRAALAPDAEAYALVQKVVDYVNALREEGCYPEDDIPLIARQVYYADYYYAQVCNGGHAQFAHNSRMESLTTNHAIEGLQAAGLDEMRDCLSTLMAAPNGADMRALDDRFFAVYGNYHERMNAFLAPFLDVKRDARYPQALARLIKRDKKREQRFHDRAALRLHAMCLDPHRMGFASAALKTGSHMTGIGAGKFLSFLGDEEVSFPLHLANGTVWWTLKIDNQQSWIVPVEPPSEIATKETLQNLVMKGMIPIFSQEMEEICRIEANTRAGLAMALLGAKWFDPSEIVSIGCAPPSDAQKQAGTRILVAASKGEGLFVFGIGTHGAILVQRDTKGTESHLGQWSTRQVNRAMKAFDDRMRAA